MSTRSDSESQGVSQLPASQLSSHHDLAGKVVLVTGAASGIGMETSRQLGALGGTILLGALTESEATLAADTLRSEGHRAIGLKLDVTADTDRDAVHDYIQSTFGVLDILINNAGVCLEPEYSVEGGTSSLPIDILRQTFEVNFFAPFLLTQRLLPLIRKSMAGRIVNVSSIQASLTLHSDPASELYDYKIFAYDTSKTALNSLSVHLAYELRDTPIKVNSVHPGWVRTEMGGAGATDDVSDGSRTSVMFALLPEDGASGGFYHFNQRLPW